MLFPASAGAADLSMVFTDCGPVGAIRAMVFDDPVAFTERQRPLAAVVVPAVDGQARATVSGLPPGPLAVAVFQDVDGDGTLKQSWLGIPAEPYGFSGGGQSSPDFDAASFALPKEGGVVVLRLR